MSVDRDSRSSDEGVRRASRQVRLTLAHQLSEMVRNPGAEPAPPDLLEAVVAAAIADIPGADLAGITLVARDGTITTPVQSAAIVREVDRIQSMTGQGPCLSSAREHRTVRADNLRTDARWPKFAARAARAGIRSMLCVQLFVADDSHGALNLYSRFPNAFDSRSEDAALMLAARAALAVVGDRADAF